MYKIKLTKWGNISEEILAENHDELRAVVTLAPTVEYSIVSVEYIEPITTAQEFIEKVKELTKPKDLEFGWDNSDSNGTEIGDIETL